MMLGLATVSLAEAFGGSWEATVGIWPDLGIVKLQTPSELIMTYTTGNWSFSSDTVLGETGWRSEKLEVGGSFSSLTLDSALSFDPAHAAFSHWQLTGIVPLPKVTLGGSLNLWATGGTWFDMWMSGTAGPATVAAYVDFGEGSGCSLPFYSASVNVDFPLSCAAVQSTVSFNCQGFNSAALKVTGVTISGLPWLSIDALLTFTSSLKTLGFSPEFNFGADGCFSLYISEATAGGTSPAPLTLAGISIDGVGLECTVGGVTFAGLSYFGKGTKPGFLTDTSYQEGYQVRVESEACCGPIGVNVTVYCLPDSSFPWSSMPSGSGLFGVVEVRAEMQLAVTKQLTISGSIDVLPVWSPVLMHWAIGLTVTW